MAGKKHAVVFSLRRLTSLHLCQRSGVITSLRSLRLLPPPPLLLPPLTTPKRSCESPPGASTSLPVHHDTEYVWHSVTRAVPRQGQSLCSVPTIAYVVFAPTIIALQRHAQAAP